MNATTNSAAAKQIEVQIMGQSYLLACPLGGESALLYAVERVDTAMCRIRDTGKVKARDRIAVLASLNLAFELSQMESDQLRGNGDTTARADAEQSSDPDTQTRMQALVQRLDSALDGNGPLL